MIDFATLQGLMIPEGVVTQIADAAGNVLWAVSGGGKVVLEVVKVTSDTYAAETLYEQEQFILLNVYPTTYGTVKVTYGGLTKTITDTSGAAEPNAQGVFFGTFNGVSDSVPTPESGELTIEGDYYAFTLGQYKPSSKAMVIGPNCMCVKRVVDFGKVTIVPNWSFCQTTYSPMSFGDVRLPDSLKSIETLGFSYTRMTSVVLNKGLQSLAYESFYETSESSDSTYTPVLKTVKSLATTPPEMRTNADGDGGAFNTPALEQIIVPKGCGAAYKAAAGWSLYADKIVEEVS